jgi:GAF domain-containing protein
MLANQATIALKNSDLFKQIAKQKRMQIEALREISESIAPPLTVDQVLDGILDWTTSLMGNEISGEVRLLDRTTQKLIVKATKGEFIEDALPKIHMGEGIIGGVAEHKQVQLVPDVQKEENYISTLANTRCEIAAPILARSGEVLGVLNIEHPQIRAFGEEDLALVETLANLAARAIESASLVDNLDALNEIGQYLTSSIELSEDQILNRIYQQAKPLMDTDNMYIALYEPDPEHPDEPGASEDREIHGTVYFGLARQDGRSVDTEKEEGWGARKAGHGLTEYVIRTKKPYCPDDVEKAYNTIATDYIQNVPESWLGVPMMVENRVLGVVVLRNEQQANVYDADDLEVLQTIASQSAIALRNTRLVQDLKESNEELEALRELQEDLSGPLSI